MTWWTWKKYQAFCFIIVAGLTCPAHEWAPRLSPERPGLEARIDARYSEEKRPERPAQPEGQAGAHPSPSRFVVVSWYGRSHHGRLMANGQRFDCRAFTCAHKTMPFGTWVRVSKLDHSTAVVLEVTDRGPYIDGRDLDISEAAAEILGLIRPGVKTFQMEVLDEP